MDRICRRVRETGDPDGISVLYLVAHGETHGQPSRIALGMGLTQATARNFILLRNCWVGLHPRIEVHSCYVASETPPDCHPNPNAGFINRVSSAIGGRVPRGQTCQPGTPGPAAPGHAIMQELANAAGVLVIAPVNAQFADFQFTFEGPVRHYRPTAYFLRRQLKAG